MTGEIEKINEVAISLLASVGKILALILLNRLNEHTSDFPLEKVQEKCIEKKKPLYVVLIDFGKTFDTVSRQGL